LTVTSTLSQEAMWWAIAISGIYHGLNPAMGWPLAVSAALMERSRRYLFSALGALAAGHFVAMLVILLPFSLLTGLTAWEREIRLVASLLVIAAGAYLLVRRRHPRVLARVPPHRLALWSFLAATAHGAGLMLLPFYLGATTDHDHMSGHDGLAEAFQSGVAPAFVVAGAHTLAMIVAGGVMAVAVYAWLGLRFISQSWFNLDALWAVSLVLVGTLSLAAAVWG
jgi:hypothetical protein